MPKKQPNIAARYLALGGIFALVCLVFTVVLGVIQFQGSKNLPDDDGLTVRKLTVSGVRGEIYDKNGTRLVGNAESYDLIYEYDAMPDTYKEINASLLKLLKALGETGNAEHRNEDYFVLDGIYPYVTFKTALSDKDSEERYWYDRFLADAGYDREITPEEFCKYFINTYRLSDTLYSNKEITELIRLWYDMRRIGFSTYNYYTLATDVTVDLVTRIKEQHIEGATVLTSTKRCYDYPGYATHILGSLGKISPEDVEHYLALGYSMNAVVGKSGCEKAFESHLHGSDGILVRKYDENGVQVAEYYEVEPVSGKNVYLTIDIDLQIAAEDSLAAQVESLKGATAGALVSQEPDTGSILAMASYPTYDITQLTDQSYVDTVNAKGAWLNRALSGEYAPGSTYKVGVALASLEQNNINLSTNYTCNHVFHEPYGYGCLGDHGRINVIEAIRVSCNIFFYSIGEKFGLEGVTSYTQRLGLGSATGIELNERVGNVASEENSSEWSISDDIQGAIGQSKHAYTPLQLNVYLSTIVNGGTRYRAHLLDSVRRFHSEESILTEEPQVIETVTFSENTYDILMEAMGKVVSGSSTLTYYFRDVPVRVGGKTGTAERGDGTSNALFCGFAPLDDPEIVVSCIIEKGEGGAYAAVPVSEVLEVYYKKKAASEPQE